MTDHATELEAKSQSGLDRVERRRERIRVSQIIAAQRARIEAVGGKPSDEEVARMVSAFHAQGGQVTICPLLEDTSDDSGNGKRR